MKIVKLKKEEFDNFASNHPLGNFYQTVAYGELMKKRGSFPHYIGIIDNKQIIGASLILSHPIFMGFKYGYAPRGILIDYNNYNKLPDILKKLKRYLFKESYLILKIDPLIIRTLKDKNGNVISNNSEISKLMSIFKKTGYNHCGFNNYMEAYKPRTHAILNIKNENANDLFSDLDKRIRTKLRKSVKFGVEVYKDQSGDLESAFELIKEKGNYSLKYYEDFKNLFQNNFEVYYAKLNTNKYVENSKILYEQQTAYNDYINELIQKDSKGKDKRKLLNKKIESDKVIATYKNHLVRSTKVSGEHPEGIIIGTAIVIKNKNTMTLLIDGYKNEFADLNPGYLLKWKIIEDNVGTNIEIFDMNAITANIKTKNPFTGLTESKLDYNAVLTEYIGEFNRVINRPVFSLYINTKKKYSLKNEQK